MNYSTNQFVFGSREDYEESYDIVNIHFPEAIFNWIPPTPSQLQKFEKELMYWKQHSKIVLLFNDHQTHYDTKGFFEPLFKLVNSYVDLVIHFGTYSMKKFKSRFPEKCMHKNINHPIYDSLLKMSTENFENRFNTNFEGKYVVSAIGNIRSKDEALMVLKVFKKIPVKNKVLVVPNMYNLFAIPKMFPYRFRKIYRFFVKLYYFFPLQHKQCVFHYNHISYELMVDLVKKTSLIIIPRKSSINSGVLFMGLTFNKAMVIPRIGNLTEVANKFNFPSLDLQKQLQPQVKAIVHYFQESCKFSAEYECVKKLHYPENVAFEYDTLLNTFENAC